MDIGVIGAGNIGGTLGRLLVQAGHGVRFGLRNPGSAAALVEELGPDAGAALPASAAEFGECLIFAGPYLAWPDFAREHSRALAGKLVIDAANPVPGRDGVVARDVLATRKPSGAYVAALLPTSHVAKAFNTVYWIDLRDKAHRPAPRLAMPFAADHPDAMRLTEHLARDTGFDPVNVGRLSDSLALESGSAIYAKSMTADEVRETLGLDRVMLAS